MPFTRAEFLKVFAEYNQAIWPTHIFIYALALVSLVLIPKQSKLSDKFATAVLSIMWILAGAGYHIVFFSKVNPVAYVFGALFILQALFLIYNGIVRNIVHFSYGHGTAAWIGWLLVAYAMVFYPVLGSIFGHRYP